MFTSTAPWWWDSATTVSATIVGVILGAVPAYLLARKSSREVLERDTLARKAQSQTIVQQIMVKMLALMDALLDLKRHIDEQFKKEGTPGRETFEPWQLVLPIAGQNIHDIPAFTAEELSILFADEKYALMQSLMLLQRRCSGAYLSFQTYGELRAILEQAFPTPSKWQGNMATTYMTPEQHADLLRHSVPLNSLIVSLREHLVEDGIMANDVAQRLTEYARVKLERPKLTIGARSDPQEAASPES